jgi:uncharacterized RDD family membrane protein YckC
MRRPRQELASAAGRIAPRLVDGAFASTLPEEVARSLVKHRVLERMVEQFAKSGALDRAVEQALQSPRTDELVDRILQSPQMRRAIEEVVAGPEVRAAMAKQTTGLAEELVVGVRNRAARLDDRLSRRPRAATSPFAGLATRAVAFGIDAAAIFTIFISLAALAALASSLFGGFRPQWLAATLLAGEGVVIAGGYAVLFWSGAGQTPGMRLMRLRVRGHAGAPPSFGRAVVRAIGTVVAIVPFFAGYLPVLFDERRRGLPDFLAGTEVVYEDPLGRRTEA